MRRAFEREVREEFGEESPYYQAKILARFPKGGSLLMCLMGGGGMLSIAIALPIMGSAFDKQGAGAALKMVAILPVILTVVFGAMFMVFKAKGGYKAEKLAAGGAPAATPAKQ